jgi:hypothetical protein
MRNVVRGAVVAGVLAVSLAPVPAFAGDGSFNIEIPATGNCVYGKTPTAQWNNGDPTTQPGELYVNNCT